MSSEAKPMQKRRRTLTPKLRFPEFASDPLHPVRLGEVTTESTIRNDNGLPPTSVMGVRKDEGIVPMEQRLIASDISRYKLVEKDYFAYNPMRLNIGSIARSGYDSDVLVSPDYVVFRCLEEGVSPGLSPEYLDHFRESHQWDAFVTEAGDGGVRVRIYYKDIAQLWLTVPDIDEQQKIADCLGSLNGLIVAQGRKLAALRDHKRGLMQQLFPQPGQAQPCLRFPEFRKEPAWKEERLSQHITLVSGIHLSPTEYGDRGEIPYFTGPSDFTNSESYVSKWTRHTDNRGVASDILITVKGSGVGELWYLELSQAALGRQLMAVRPLNGVSRFYFQLLLSKRWLFEDLAMGNLIPGLSRGDILNLKTPLPKEEEQQEIADCLTALDTQITAQASKIEALKQYKRGLMQQLFPASEEP